MYLSPGPMKKTSLKVGFVSAHAFNRPGGVKSHILGLHTEYAKRGIESKIIVPRRFAAEQYGDDVLFLGTSLDIHISGSNSDLSVNFNPLAVERLLRREDFDILHFHNFGFPMVMQVLRHSHAVNVF